MLAIRWWFGPQSHTASIAGSRTIDSIESNALCLADASLARQGRRLLGAGRVGAVDPANVRVAHRDEGLDVEARDEAASDEADSQGSLSLMRRASVPNAAPTVSRRAAPCYSLP